ncbi:MAG: hypothetical protein ACXW0O_08440 [Methylosarcina sp.]
MFECIATVWCIALGPRQSINNTTQKGIVHAKAVCTSCGPLDKKM